MRYSLLVTDGDKPIVDERSDKLGDFYRLIMGYLRAKFYDAYRLNE